jgi:hypothetical protein
MYGPCMTLPQPMMPTRTGSLAMITPGVGSRAGRRGDQPGPGWDYWAFAIASSNVFCRKGVYLSIVVWSASSFCISLPCRSGNS